MLSKLLPYPPPPRPSRYLNFSSAHRRCTTAASSWWTWVPTAHSLPVPSIKWFDPAKCFLTWYTLSDERSAPQLQSFLVGGRASSTASDRQRARQPSLHVSSTRAPPYILFLGPYTSVYYVHVIMMSWLVVGSQVKAKRGIALAKRWTMAPWFNLNNSASTIVSFLPRLSPKAVTNCWCINIMYFLGSCWA